MRSPNIAARSRFLAVCGALLLLAAPAACTKKALQRLDGSGGGILPPPTDAGPGFDGAAADSLGVADADNGATDAAWDVAFAGRRSFDVTSHVSTGGMEIVHTFTMTLDPDQRIAIIGTPGNGDVEEVEQTAGGGLRLPLGVGRTLAFAIPAVEACSASISYDDLRFIVDASGQLSGTGHGLWATYPAGGVGNLPVTMVLEGVPDADPPTLSLVAGGDLADPWTPLWVVASEPLPGEQPRPALRSTGGDFQSFEAQSSGNDPFVAVLARPTRLLRFGDQYRVTFDGITDFARHAPTSTASATFTTRPLPPLVAADGFESVTDETLGGARVLSGAGAPTINGARSLYLPPVDSLGTGSTVTQFALRLPIAPGNTVVRFAYRTVNPGDTSNIYYLVASVGGPIGTAQLFADPGNATTPATIDQTAVTLGPIQTATIGLPGSTYVEVVLARTASQPTSCGGPAPRPVPGIIIDDLRAE
jgi:hypothetical protein